MTIGASSARAVELAAQGTPFVVATVVRAQRPTSVQAGDSALVLGDGTIEGFVGGVCAQQSVSVYALMAMGTGDALLLRILPDGSVSEHDGPEEEGAVTIQNPCLSGGAIEVFLEPVLPAPRVLVVGATPIATAVLSLGAAIGLDLVAVDGATPEPLPGDLGLVVAAHGRDELHTLRRGLEAGVPYVGLVASLKRGAAVLDVLRADGVPDEQLRRIDVPAGIDIGARTPPEIALTILANVVAARRGRHAVAGVAADAASVTPAKLAIDPVCGMTVAAVVGTPSVEYEGGTVYFCCEGCAATFQREHAVATD